MNKRYRVLSLGAGTQSSTLALMMAAREIEPPDFAVFADTQAEPADVYEWLDWLEPLLPFPVYRVTAGNLIEDSLQLKRHQETGELYLHTRLPMFVLKRKRDGGGEVGMLSRSCTRDYKVVPIRRQIKKIGKTDISAWKTEARMTGERIPAVIDQVIGISWDETERMRSPDKLWIRNLYPLVEMRITRAECVKYITDKFDKAPPRSACVMCPYHDDEEWRHLSPVELQRAIDYERGIQELQLQQDNPERHKGMFYLHQTCKPLDQVDFDPHRGQLNLFNQECTGMCGA